MVSVGSIRFLLASFCACQVRICAPIWPSLALFIIPFQYPMSAIAFANFGHHGTLLTGSFLHFASASSFALVGNWPMCSNWCHRVEVNLCLADLLYRCSSTAFMLSSLRAASSTLFYLVTTRGLSHMRHLAFNGAVGDELFHPKISIGILTQTTLWSLSMLWLNAR